MNTGIGTAICSWGERGVRWLRRRWGLKGVGTSLARIHELLGRDGGLFSGIRALRFARLRCIIWVVQRRMSPSRSEAKALQRGFQRGAPFGRKSWVGQVASERAIESTLCLRSDRKLWRNRISKWE
jgi:hypothetical protein